jgi:hypothetical protein
MIGNERGTTSRCPLRDEPTEGTRMATPKQIEANRANAQKSSGPRTEEGRRRSRGNAWKHGLAAGSLVAPDECVEELEALRVRLLEHAPQSTLAFELVERLAAILWRLRRILKWETGLIYARNAQVWEGAPAEHWKDNPEDEQFDWKNSVRYGLLLARDAARGDAFGKLSLRGIPDEGAREDPEVAVGSSRTRCRKG